MTTKIPTKLLIKKGKRFFSRKDVQDYFIYHLENTYHGNLSATLADPQIKKPNTLLYEEFSKHGDTEFKKRVEVVKQKFDENDDSKWEKDYRKNFKVLSDYMMADMLKQAGSKKKVQHTQYNTITNRIENHSHNKRVTKKLEKDTLKVEAEIEKIKADTERIKAVTAGLQNGTLDLNGMNISLNVMDAVPAAKAAEKCSHKKGSKKDAE